MGSSRSNGVRVATAGLAPVGRYASRSFGPIFPVTDGTEERMRTVERISQREQRRAFIRDARGHRADPVMLEVFIENAPLEDRGCENCSPDRACGNCTAEYWLNLS